MQLVKDYPQLDLQLAEQCRKLVTQACCETCSWLKNQQQKGVANFANKETFNRID